MKNFFSSSLDDGVTDVVLAVQDASFREHWPCCFNSGEIRRISRPFIFLTEIDLGIEIMFDKVRLGRWGTVLLKDAFLAAECLVKISDHLVKDFAVAGTLVEPSSDEIRSEETVFGEHTVVAEEIFNAAKLLERRYVIIVETAKFFIVPVWTVICAEGDEI